MIRLSSFSFLIRFPSQFCMLCVHAILISIQRSIDKQTHTHNIYISTINEGDIWPGTRAHAHTSFIYTHVKITGIIFNVLAHQHNNNNNHNHHHHSTSYYCQKYIFIYYNCGVRPKWRKPYQKTVSFLFSFAIANKIREFFNHTHRERDTHLRIETTHIQIL